MNVTPFPAPTVVRPQAFQRADRCAAVIQPLDGLETVARRYYERHNLLRGVMSVEPFEPAKAMRHLATLAGLRNELEQLEAEIMAALHPTEPPAAA